MLRFSIRQLLIGTALVAVAIVALLNASEWWSSALTGGVFLTLSAAVVLAIFRDGQRRTFWIGFAVFGWLYWGLLLATQLLGTVDYSLRRQSLITERLTESIYHLGASGYPSPDPFADPLPPNTDPFAVPLPPPPPKIIAPLWAYAPDHDDFVHVGHALWNIALAVGGGWFAVWASATRQRARGQA